MAIISIPLKELVAVERPRLKSFRLRPINHPSTYENELYSIIFSMINDWRKWIREVLIPNYDEPSALVIDADMTTIFRMLRQKGIEVDSTLIYQTDRLGRWVTRVGEWHGRRIRATVLSATGVRIDPFIRLSDVEQVLSDAIQRNVSLISGINADIQKRMSEVVAESFALRRNKKDFTRAIADAMGITQKRARFIAGDQTSKLNSLLTELRQSQLGFDSYIWDTQEDERVRPAHRVRHGKVFKWSHPPLDGHPGWPVNCRCRAIAYMAMGD